MLYIHLIFNIKISQPFNVSIYRWLYHINCKDIAILCNIHAVEKGVGLVIIIFRDENSCLVSLLTFMNRYAISGFCTA